MKIVKVNEECILFDNGSKIWFEHDVDCCEYNYADFAQIEELAKSTDFDESLIFEEVEDSGFRFGNESSHMFFIPCYSQQYGYYSTNLNIYFNRVKVLYVDCPIID